MVEEFSDQIGERLQMAREKADLTVDDVVFKTRIPKSVVEALEAADFSVFSSPMYAKSFLSQYSDFLRVDAGLWLDALEPATFLGGEIVSPLWLASRPEKKEVRVPERDQAPESSWFSTFSMLAVSCCLIFAAVQGYQFFESRFGVEVNASDFTKTPEAPPQGAAPAVTPTASAPPRTPDATAAVARKQEDEFAQPPPRAIIVR
jgi:cytoskeletal protein RodZ